MAITQFAAIDIGSYNVSMEIFEVGRKNGLRSLTSVRMPLELGKDTFALKKISMEKLGELIRILTDYKRIMKEYGVTDLRACAKSAFREAENRDLIIDHILRATGIRVDILSNSEQRFLGYKSIASRGEEFQKFIEKGTAIVDIGGGSAQISLFDKDALVSTQNLLLGSLRIRENLSRIDRETLRYDALIEELIRSELVSFRKMYLKNRRIENIILVGDYFTNLIFQNRSDMNKTETRDEFMEWYKSIAEGSPREVGEEMGISSEVSTVLIPMAVLYRMLINEFDVQTIWLPGIQLTDGIAYDYGERKKLIKSSHDFENDILRAARNMSRRYASNKQHNEALVAASETIFNAVRKICGLVPRDRLLLKVACYLHDCGKYISMTDTAESSYNIIMSTEIIGLSDRERSIIANVVRFNTRSMAAYNPAERPKDLSTGDYMLALRLAAILRLAGSLDVSYKQKADSLKVSVKDRELHISIGTKEDYTLERGFFDVNSEFFEEIFDLKPMLKVRTLG